MLADTTQKTTADFEIPKHLAVMPEHSALDGVAYDGRFGPDRRDRGRRLLRVFNRFIQPRRAAHLARDPLFGRPDLIENDHYRFLRDPAVNSAG
jgi:hypothetical protein